MIILHINMFKEWSGQRLAIIYKALLYIVPPLHIRMFSTMFVLPFHSISTTCSNPSPLPLVSLTTGDNQSRYLTTCDFVQVNIT